MSSGSTSSARSFPRPSTSPWASTGPSSPPLVGYPSSIGLEVDLGVVLTGSVAPPPDPLPEWPAGSPPAAPLTTGARSSYSATRGAPRRGRWLRVTTRVPRAEHGRGRPPGGSRGEPCTSGPSTATVLCSVVGIASDGGGVARYPERRPPGPPTGGGDWPPHLVAKAGAFACPRWALGGWSSWPTMAVPPPACTGARFRCHRGPVGSLGLQLPRPAASTRKMSWARDARREGTWSCDRSLSVTEAEDWDRMRKL